MNWEEFVTNVVTDLTEMFERAGYPAKVQFHRVEKMQRNSYDAISVRLDGSHVGVLYPLQESYEAHRDGMGFGDILDDIYDSILENWNQEIAHIDPSQFMDYEWAKPRLMLQMVEKENNQGVLRKCPYQDFGDFALVCRFEVEIDENHVGSALIEQPLLQRYGVSKEQLFQDAFIETQARTPMRIRDMVELIPAMTGIELSELEAQMGQQYVAMFEGNEYGAAVMALPGFMEDAAKMVGGNFYLIPSSVEEVILVPESAPDLTAELEEMLQSINAAIVAPEKVLADHVYHYDAAAKVFERGDVYEMRKEMEQVVGGGRSSVMLALSAAQEEVKHTPKKPVKAPAEPSR